MGKLNETAVKATFDLRLWEQKRKLSLAEVKTRIIGICREFHGGVPDESHPQFSKVVAFVDAALLNDSVPRPLLSGLYGSVELIGGGVDVPSGLVRVNDFKTWKEQIIQRRKHMTAFQRRPDVDSRVAEAVISEDVLIVILGTRHFLGGALVALMEEVGELAGEWRTDVLISLLSLGYAERGKKACNRVLLQGGRIFPDVVNNVVGIPRRDGALTQDQFRRALAGKGEN